MRLVPSVMSTVRTHVAPVAAISAASASYSETGQCPGSQFTPSLGIMNHLAARAVMPQFQEYTTNVTISGPRFLSRMW